MTSASAVTVTRSVGATPWLLSLANFAVCMGVFVVIGILSPVAADLGVSKAQAGSLLTVYAVVYALISPHPATVDRLVLIDAAGLKVTLAGPPPVNFAPDTAEEMHALLATVLDAPFAQTREFAAQALAG
jgi:hypothetical protein